ncbi:UNVERIFIED_ORG: lysylphosphatidylglycerol synthetase-like protein (DUF2156 family) [Arthrobacter sp. UYEF13]
MTVRTVPGRWWTVVSSAFWARDLFGYVLGTVLILVVGVPVERRLGSARVLAVASLAQFTGVLAAMGFWQLIRPLAGEWLMGGMYFAGPSLLAWGVAAAGTAAMGTLWRRRLRLGIFALLVLLALYSGGFADLARLIAGATGALLGPLFLGRRPGRKIFVSSRHEGRVLVAVLVAVSAIGPVIAGLVPHAMGPLSVLRLLFTGIEPVDAQTVQDLCTAAGRHRECEAARLQLRAGAGGLFMAIVPSVLLLLLAEGLRRGRRFAWGAVLVLQSCLSALSLVVLIQVLQSTGQDSVAGEVVSANLSGSFPAHPLSLVVPLLMPLLLLTVLVACRRLFPVAAPRGTYARLAIQVLVLAVALAVLYIGSGLVLAQDFSPVPTPAGLLADVPDRFLPLGFAVDVLPAFFPQTFPAIVLYEGVGIVFWAVTGALVLRTFLGIRPTHSGDDKAKARAILTAGEGSSISWMTLWSGNRYWFSRLGDSFIAYRVIASVALTLGGPVGPKTRMTELITEFSLYCRANGWTPCLYSVPQDVRDTAVALGWEAAEVGQETVLPLENLSFKGKKFQDIRTALNKADKAGIYAEWVTYPAASRVIQSQIQEVSEEWVAERNMPEMGFTLGGLDELDDPEVQCLIAVDSERRVHAVTSWLPVYRHGNITGRTLDVMRRRSDGFRPAIEFLIASAASSLREEGLGFISLSAAPLARIPGSGTPDQIRDDAGPNGLERILNALGSALEPVYGFRSLLAFKGKFHPRYQTLFMTYPDSAALPGIAQALTRAYVPSISLGDALQLVGRIIRRQNHP